MYTFPHDIQISHLANEEKLHIRYAVIESFLSFQSK
jgi:hypothetical protein